jgi:hypothetical protein
MGQIEHRPAKPLEIAVQLAIDPALNRPAAHRCARIHSVKSDP